MESDWLKWQEPPSTLEWKNPLGYKSTQQARNLHGEGLVWLHSPPAMEVGEPQSLLGQSRLLTSSRPTSSAFPPIRERFRHKAGTHHLVPRTWSYFLRFWFCRCSKSRVFFGWFQQSFIYIFACKDSSYCISKVSGVWGESHNLVWDVDFAVNLFCLLAQSCQHLVLVLVPSCRLGRVRRSSPFFFCVCGGESHLLIGGCLRRSSPNVKTTMLFGQY